MKNKALIIFASIIAGTASLIAQENYYTANQKDYYSKDVVTKLIDTYQKTLPAGKYVFAEVVHQTEKKDSLIFHWHYAIVKEEPESQIQNSEELSLVGSPFPNFKISSDSLIDLKSLRGKPVFINFWFTACEPCIAEIDVLNRFKSTYGDEMHFIAVTFDSKERVNQFLSKKPFGFLMHTDDYILLEKLGLNKSFPRNFLINRKGEIVRVFGGVPFTKKEGTRVIGAGSEIEKEIKQVIRSPY